MLINHPQIKFFVGHNISFDMNILAAEMHRLHIDIGFVDKPALCTMHDSTNLCAIPGKYGHKWPKLEELYGFLFPEKELSVTSLHDALFDIQITRECFFELALSRGSFQSGKRPLTVPPVITPVSPFPHRVGQLSNM